VNKFTEMQKAEIEAVKIAIRTQMRILLGDLPTSSYKYFKGCIVSGGVSASLFHGETPNDWDVYLRDPVTAYEFKQYVLEDNDDIMKLVKEVNANYKVRKHPSGRLITDWAVTFNNGLQVIVGEEKEHRKTFDFVHCMPYFDMESQSYYISEQQYHSIKNREIIINPNCAKEVEQHRLEKYMERGWTHNGIGVVAI
jgi:hypothetical protein